MPGLVGIVSAGAPDETRLRFDRASARMQRHANTTLEAEHTGPGWHAGWVHLGHRKRPAGVSRTDRTVLLLHGDVDGADFRGSQAAAELTRRYERDGEPFVHALEGSFAIAVLDTSRRRLVLASDAFGTQPLYWTRDAGGMIFASDLSAVIAARSGPTRLDVRAVADYLTLGSLLEDRTLADGIHLLDPGTVLVYDTDTDAVSFHRYASIDQLFGPKVSDKRQWFEQVGEAFRGAVDRALAVAAPAGLALSGGLDSRAILSAINGRARQLRTYTLGVDGCADHLIGERLAGIAGTRHEFFELNASYLRDFLPNMAAMVSVTDGMYLSHGLTEMLALEFIDTLGLHVLLRGHGGELAKAHLAWPLHTDPHVYTLGSIEQLVTYLSTRANYITPKLGLNELLTPDAKRVAGRGSQDSFQSALTGTGLSPSDACSYLYLRELNRRFTIPSLELFRTRVDVRMPFVDWQFLRVLLAAPSEWRDSTEVHKALTAIGLPALNRVRNSNTGARANAGPFTEAVWDKFNTLFKRLDVRGFRHYHNFDGWMRSMLLETVEAELLKPTSRIQAFVRHDALKRVLDETRSGTGDHAYLLQVLLILELWQRENNVEAIAA